MGVKKSKANTTARMRKNDAEIEVANPWFSAISIQLENLRTKVDALQTALDAMNHDEDEFSEDDEVEF